MLQVWVVNHHHAITHVNTDPLPAHLVKPDSTLKMASIPHLKFVSITLACFHACCCFYFFMLCLCFAAIVTPQFADLSWASLMSRLRCELAARVDFFCFNCFCISQLQLHLTTLRFFRPSQSLMSCWQGSLVTRQPSAQLSPLNREDANSTDPSGCESLCLHRGGRVLGMQGKATPPVFASCAALLVGTLWYHVVCVSACLT